MSSNADERDLARIRALCRTFPEAEEGRLQDRPLFHVRRRRFALFNGDGSPPRPRWHAFGRSLHFATDPSQHPVLERDPRLTTSPHHGFRGWLAIDLRTRDVDWRWIATLLETAYRQVAGRSLVAQLEVEKAEDHRA